MSPFEYIIGIHSIVLGLALANVLTAIADTVKHRATIELYWVHTGWAAYLVFTCLAWWWALWQLLADVEILTLYGFLRDFVVSIIVYICTRLLTPDMAKEEQLDLESYFFRVKNPLFFCIMLIWIILAVNQFSASYLSMNEQYQSWVVYLIWSFYPLRIAILSWGIISSNPRTSYTILLVIWVVAFVEESLQFGVGQ